MAPSSLQQSCGGRPLSFETKKKSFWTTIIEYRYMYLLILPAILFYIIFCYVPMYGIQLAFKDFNFAKGVFASSFIGLDHFEKMFSLTGFRQALINTLIIAGQRLLIEFPFPIIVTLLLNEVRNNRLKKVYQTVYTFPHFLSWVIVSGIMVNFLSSNGTLNQLLGIFGFTSDVSLLTQASAFRWILYSTSIWKEMGWGTIIYLAAIASIDPQLYESATIDGANRWQQMKAITWPCLRNTVAILFILAIGGIMNGGFDQIYNMYNPTVYDVSEIIDTYVYRVAFLEAGDYGFSTAVGLFKSIINAFMLFGANYVVKLLGQDGIL